MGRAIETGLEKPLEEVFREIDPEPVGAASIAQVHRAVTSDGKLVAVKVLRPNIEEDFARALDTYEWAAAQVEGMGGEIARLRSHIAGEEAFFGEVARFVKSDVLMRLKVSSGSPDGIMCFGSRNPEAFGPEMATELLFFLAKVLENTIRAWLDLPE